MSEPDADLSHDDLPDPAATPTGTARVAVAADLDAMDPEFAVVAARAAHAKGAVDILVLRVGDVLAITDYFVIASASNPRLVRSVIQDIEDQVARAGGPRPVRIEGLNEAEWVLADYGTFVVHVFHTETRRYYELERLWADVASIEWPDPEAPAPPADPGN